MNFTLPLKVEITNTYWFFDDCFFEEGMIFDITEIELDSIEDESIVLTVKFCQKKYKEYNTKFLTNCYYENIYTPKNTGRELFDAIEAGQFTDEWIEYIEVSDGELFETRLFRGVKLTNTKVEKNEIY